MLVVTRLDRLARSTRDLLNILDAIGKAGARQGHALAYDISYWFDGPLQGVGLLRCDR